MAESTQLVTIEKAKALAIFSKPGEIDPILARIREQIDDFKGDASTKRGREDIASVAYRVSQTKAYLDGVGKALVDELKDVPKKVDASRKKVRDTLDSWRDEVRKPLTDWEAAEEARIGRHKGMIARLTEIATTPNAGCPIDTTADQFREKIASIGKIELGARCEEFETEYALGVAGALRALHTALGAAEKREAEAVELACLRAAEAERGAREQAARDLAEHEARARADADRREREVAAEAERIEARRIAAEERAAREKAEAEASALREAEAARQRREREELARQAAERAEAEKREANTRHRARVNREAAEAIAHVLVITDSDGLTKADLAKGKAIIEAIIKGQVPHVSIYY